MMAIVRVPVRILYLLLFIQGVIADLPPVSPANFHNIALLPADRSLTNLSTGQLEIRGLRDGRMKRFVFTRADDPCCDATRCRSVRGEFLDDKCKCKKCPKSKFPGPNGKTCQDDCPAGTEKVKGSRGCCRRGQQPNKKKSACEPTPDRKGPCGDGFILDSKEGSQSKLKDKDKVCTPDDDSKCKPGEIAETRSADDKDPKKKKDCAKPDPENDKKKCKPKKEYEHYDIWTDVNGNKSAKKTCRQTKNYEKNKNNNSRFDKIKAWKQQVWDREKPARDRKKEEERKKKEEEERKKKEEEERRKKEEEERRKKAEEDRVKDKKKERIGKCLPVVALMEGLNAAGGTNIPDVEKPYQWTSEFFDEDFITNDSSLDFWPGDLPLDEKVSVDTEAFKKEWAQTLEDKLDAKKPKPNCPGGRKRCTKRDEHPTPFEKPRHEKRFFQFLIAIANFARTIAMAIASRVTAVVARIVPRVKDIQRLFQLAKPGQSAIKATVQNMRAAAQRIVKNPNFRECLRAGVPL
ncbi:hypothetical protein B0J11DRAFT_601672 [Dendryphion nanum]|uniref:Uncharacterized protein n=1 Tax=Dendryphion nanum TaxID=256645 RepID=A0A9P9CYN3_9PLEO|nr:hypothetical protein B0J11DRAFT_601672 [Dendryphion nanum]